MCNSGRMCEPPSVLGFDERCRRCGAHAPPAGLPHCGAHVVELDPARAAPYAVALWLAGPVRGVYAGP